MTEQQRHARALDETQEPMSGSPTFPTRPPTTEPGESAAEGEAVHREGDESVDRGCGLQAGRPG